MVITELLSPMRFIRTFTGLSSTLKPGWRTKQLENCQTDEVGRHHKVEENRSVQGVDKASHTAILSCLVPSPDRNSDDSIGFFRASSRDFFIRQYLYPVTFLLERDCLWSPKSGYEREAWQADILLVLYPTGHLLAATTGVH